MGFLNPVLLALAAGTAVPLLLHLLHRSEGRRVAFPALRYLLRAERDHARRIRTRQLLLLLIRIAAILVVTLAAARLVLAGAGAAHPPTAVALILDNSLSSGRVVEGERVLDILKARALEAVELAGPQDVFWVLRAGEPWEVAAPVPGSAARQLIVETRVSGAVADLTATLSRARDLLLSAPQDRREVQLLSDLQATGLRDASVDLTGIPVVAWAGIPTAPGNRRVTRVRVGGGLPPRANRRTEVAVEVEGVPGDTSRVPLRIFLGGQLRGATQVPVGGTAVVPINALPQGVVEGYAEIDPDALRADDRYHVVVTVAPPPAVAVVGSPGVFLEDALTVLEEAGRVRRVPAPRADVLIAVGGAGMGSAGGVRRIVVIPEGDPALRTALTRRLDQVGLPLAVEAGGGEQGRLEEDRTGVGLEGLGVRRTHTLRPTDPAATRTLIARADGSPWLVAWDGPEAEFLVLASPLEPDEGDLPVRAAMVPFVEWLVSPGRGAGGGGDQVAGQALPLPVQSTEVLDPSGTRYPTDGTHELRATREVGIYSVLAGDSVLARVAVNAPPGEGVLAPASEGEVRAAVAADPLVLAGSPAAWRNRIFVDREGRELWQILLALGFGLLLGETWVASSGGARASRTRAEP